MINPDPQSNSSTKEFFWPSGKLMSISVTAPDLRQCLFEGSHGGSWCPSSILITSKSKNNFKILLIYIVNINLILWPQSFKEMFH